MPHRNSNHRWFNRRSGCVQRRPARDALRDPSAMFRAAAGTSSRVSLVRATRRVKRCVLACELGPDKNLRVPLLVRLLPLPQTSLVSLIPLPPSCSIFSHSGDDALSGLFGLSCSIYATLFSFPLDFANSLRKCKCGGDSLRHRRRAEPNGITVRQSTDLDIREHRVDKCPRRME